MKLLSKGFGILLFVFVVGTAPAFSQFTDIKWKVIGFAGEGWFAEPEEALGHTQDFHKGWANGYFFDCNFEGLSKTYNHYSLVEFLENPEFDTFRELNAQLQINGDDVFVHRLTCDGNKRVLYPFVTVEPRNKAYYLYEGAIYIFEHE